MNPKVGDLAGNAARLIEAYDRAEAAGCDIIAFPELSITGYPPEDLVLKPGFVAACRQSLDKVAARTGSCAAVLGFVDGAQDLYNAAAVCADGVVAGVVHKRLLPNYGPFDERRYFTPGQGTCVFDAGGVRVGDHARIGANAVVVCDVPAGATAVGVPARVIAQ